MDAWREILLWMINFARCSKNASLQSPTRCMAYGALRGLMDESLVRASSASVIRGQPLEKSKGVVSIAI
jgi:hypothetical protein